MMPDKSEAPDSAPEAPLEDKVIDDSVVSDQDSTAGDIDSTAEAVESGSGDIGTEASPNASIKGDGEPTVAGEQSPAGDAGVQGELVDDEEDELTRLRRQLEEAESRADQNWDRLLRLQADMENQRKRAQNDVNKARKFALEGIVGDLLPVKDSLEMGLSAAQADDADPKAVLEGVELTLKQLSQAFEKNNIVEINPVDEKFDPEFHQAMSMQEVEGKATNTVTAVMQKGYTLNDRLVRPALVMVAR